MTQLKFHSQSFISQVVNVASVAQRSPFRYPGGKTWLIPKIRQWLLSLKQPPSLFIEPFTGGGIVSLSVAFDGLADRVLMVEIDKQVASVWETMLSENAGLLADKIQHFDMSYESLINELNKKDETTLDLAFKTLLRNRTSHGGILAPGAGLIKYGENGKGVLSRWYPNTLAKRIRDINIVINKIQFIHGNGLEIIKEHIEDNNTVFFIDPPYTAAGKKAGKRLYPHNELDHEYLFSLLGSIKCPFLMTYDNAAEIKQMAYRHDFEFIEIAMNNTHHAKMNELLISKNLKWVTLS